MRKGDVMAKRDCLAAAAALGLSLAAGSASAAVVHQLSGNGDYDIAWDPAQQSLPITVTDFFDHNLIHFDGNFVGDPENDGLGNGITETIFHILLNVTYTPTPGHVFTGVDVSEGANWHHAFFGGEEFGQTTTFHPLFGGPDVVVTEPTWVNIPPWGQGGGGGASGLINGSAIPPAHGFTMISDQTIVLFDSSTWTVGSLALDFQTAAAPVSGVPEPGGWLLLIAGFGGLGAAMRRRRAALSFG
jgi:hypothetical protein